MPLPIETIIDRISDAKITVVFTGAEIAGIGSALDLAMEVYRREGPTALEHPAYRFTAQAREKIVEAINEQIGKFEP